MITWNNRLFHNFKRRVILKFIKCTENVTKILSFNTKNDNRKTFGVKLFSSATKSISQLWNNVLTKCQKLFIDLSFSCPFLLTFRLLSKSFAWFTLLARGVKKCKATQFSLLWYFKFHLFFLYCPPKCLWHCQPPSWEAIK